MLKGDKNQFDNPVIRKSANSIPNSPSTFHLLPSASSPTYRNRSQKSVPSPVIAAAPASRRRPCRCRPHAPQPGDALFQGRMGGEKAHEALPAKRG